MCKTKEAIDKAKENPDTEPKPSEECPVTVDVQAETGVHGCEFIPKGKTRKYKSVGTPGGGTYKWSATGKISIVGSDSSETVEIKGDNVSDSLQDSELKITYTKGKSAEGKLKITVVEFTEIKATVKPTPPNTVRAGFAAPAVHVFTSTSLDKDFTANQPLVLMQNAQPDTKLEVKAKPAGLPIKWKAVRNTADHASLGSSSEVPTLTSSSSNVYEAELNANAKGSFHIYAYVDCHQTGDYKDDHDPAIPLNLVLATSTLVTDNTAVHQAKITATLTAGMFNVRNGTWNGGLPEAGIAMDADFDVTGGGADGRLGLEKVFGGLINLNVSRDVHGTYRNSSVSPATDHRLSFVGSSNSGSATGTYAGKPMFVSGDPATVLHIQPLLDSGRNNTGTGGDTATMGRSNISSRTNRPVGQRMTIQCIDSPGMAFVKLHPASAAAVLRQVHYHYAFRACFCFWTNVSQNVGATGDPCDRVYSVARMVDWGVVGDWTINYGATPPTSAATTPHRIRITNRTTVSPIGRAQDHGIEVRPPSGIIVGAYDGRV